MSADALLYYPLVGVLRLFQRFRKESPVEPHAREARDYEWQAQHVCSYCKLEGRARFIEWLPERVVTVECPTCHYEETLE